MRATTIFRILQYILGLLASLAFAGLVPGTEKHQASIRTAITILGFGYTAVSLFAPWLLQEKLKNVPHERRKGRSRAGRRQRPKVE